MGIKLQYLSQERPEGTGPAFIIGADFIGEESVALVLGDNIFHGMGSADSWPSPASRSVAGSSPTR